MEDHREPEAREAQALIPARKISRRAMVAGAVATVAVGAVLPLSSFAFAQTANHEDMVAFLVLSAAVTGVDIHILAPEFSRSSGDILNDNPGVDPIDIKDAYFTQAKTAAAFEKLLQIAKDNHASQNAQNDIIAKVNASDDTKFLARSVVLLWYLGSWYDPEVLKKAANHPESVDGPIAQKVLSPKAYSQGLVWLIAGAHPMGYSNLQFGYWSRNPLDQNGNPVQLFSPAKFPL
jgi:hypothetical protein